MVPASGWLDFIDRAKEFVDGVQDKVKDSISAIIDDVTKIYEDTRDKVDKVITPVIDKVKKVITPIIDKVVSPVEKVIDKVNDIVDAVVDKVRDNITNGVDDLVDGAKGIIDKVVDTVDDVVDKFQDVVDDVTQGVQKGIDTVVTPIVGGVSDIFSAIPDVFQALVAGLGAVLPGALAPVVAGVVSGANAGQAVSNALAIFPKLAELTELLNSPDQAIRSLKTVTDSEPSKNWGEWASKLIEKGGMAASLIGMPFGLLPMLGSCYSSGIGASIENIARSLYHPSRLGLTELSVSYIRGILGYEAVVHDAGQLGFSEDDVKTSILLTRQLLSTGDLIALWLRKELTDEELGKKLFEAGVALDDQELLKKLAYYIPNITDIIHMAVREAFTPEIAEKFGQYQDYPEAVTEWANKQGLSEEWAKRYWAAHWELPGANMGFEMFWRKIITKDELATLLRALDVMPYWRDKLIQLAYQPITRVDIRRMHKLGVIKAEELPARYEDIGYSPENAKLQAQFTISLNTAEAKVETQAERDLTGSDIMAAYDNGILPADTVSGLLTELGYDENEVAFKLALADAKHLAKLHTAQVNIIKQRRINGWIDDNGVIDAFGKLDLSPWETQYQLADLQLDLEAQQAKEEKNPERALTSSEISTAYASNIVDRDTATTLLLDLGFAQWQVELKLSLVDVKRKK